MHTSQTAYHPPGLILQWHITERCNWQCHHCYQEAGSEVDLSLSQLAGILEQFSALLALWNESGKPVRGHISITGGEPLIHPQVEELLELIARRHDQFSFALLTNGTLLDDRWVKTLRRLRPRYVQVSLDGGLEAHDALRGPGNFSRVIEGIRHLRREGLYTVISFSAHRDNYREFPVVAEWGRRLKANRVWSDRIVPIGHGKTMHNAVLSPEMTREYCQLLQHTRRKFSGYWFKHTEIAAHRALQFLCSGSRPYHCTAGDSLITVLPNGDLIPCRRMPIVAGNLLDKPLQHWYYQSSLFCALRDRTRLPDGCQHCAYREACRGGLKCLAYALYDDPFAGDPGCWLKKP